MINIIEMDVNALKEYENNPRNNAGAVEAVANSIKEFGFKVPIIIDANNVIVAGHTRLKAAKSLNMEMVPCIVADDLTDEQIKAFRLADNKVGELATWDFEKLDLELNSLDMDMELFGFENINGGALSEGGETVQEDVFTVELPKEAKTKRGDIYQLGNHRLMCGDSTNRDDINTLIDNASIDMIFTDPPYDMQMGGGGCFEESTKNVKKRIDNIINFDPYTIAHLAELDTNSVYICTSKDGVKKYLDIFKDYDFNILVWCKTNQIPFTNNTFLPDIEYILYFSKSGRIWNNGLKPTSTYKKYFLSDKEQGRKDGGEDMHPTMKPIELIADKVRISSNENGNVLDLFGGSGSTLIACEQLNRSCYMMEYEPQYVDVIIDRWEKFTGQKAELIENSEVSMTG